MRTGSSPRLQSVRHSFQKYLNGQRSLLFSPKTRNPFSARSFQRHRALRLRVAVHAPLTVLHENQKPDAEASAPAYAHLLQARAFENISFTPRATFLSFPEPRVTVPSVTHLTSDEFTSRPQHVSYASYARTLQPFVNVNRLFTSSNLR